MTMRQTSGILLSSAFHSRAELHGTLEDVRKAMADMPGIKLAFTGTRIRYAIQNPKNRNEAEAMVEFAPNCITLRFFFKTPSAYEFKRNFLRFVAILAYLKDLYTVKMCDLYCYVMEALRQEQDTTVPLDGVAAEDLARVRICALGSVNASLSHALSLANARVKEKDKHLASYKEFSKEIIEGLVRRNDKELLNAVDALCAFGVDKGLAGEISLLVAENNGKT